MPDTQTPLLTNTPPSNNPATVGGDAVAQTTPPASPVQASAAVAPSKTLEGGIAAVTATQQPSSPLDALTAPATLGVQTLQPEAVKPSIVDKLTQTPPPLVTNTVTSPPTSAPVVQKVEAPLPLASNTSGIPDNTPLPTPPAMKPDLPASSPNPMPDAPTPNPTPMTSGNQTATPSNKAVPGDRGDLEAKAKEMLKTLEKSGDTPPQKRPDSKKVKLVATGLGVATLLLGIAVGTQVIQRPGIGDIRQQAAAPATLPDACQPGEGKVVVTFNQGLRSDKTQTEAQTVVEAVNLDPGSYEVTLVSYDDHVNKPDQTQPKEQWYVAFLSGTTRVAQSQPIDDLPDNLDVLTEQVETHLVIAQPVTGVQGIHYAYPDTSSANSIWPSCAVFTSTTGSGSLSCSGLSYTPVAPPLGATVTLTCSPGQGQTADYSEFQYSIDGGTFEQIPSKTVTTAELVVAEPGDYVVRCRVCKTSGSDSACSEWQAAE